MDYEIGAWGAGPCVIPSGRVDVLMRNRRAFGRAPARNFS